MRDGKRRTRITRTVATLVTAAALVGGGAALVVDRTSAHATGAPTGASAASTAATGAPTGASAASPAPPAAPAQHGRMTQVTIPGDVSRFAARPGYVYLPPAAARPDAGRFPVVIALSGQSRFAQPSDVVVRARIGSIMDGIAARNGGRAPIVVVPDQLSAGPRNPMCVDSPLGHVDTYLTVDVRQWVLTHLPTLPDRQDWTIAGFSEGGTCAIQLGAAHPDLFGSLVDASGEEAPANGSLAHTIAVGFGGSRAAYDRATPFTLLDAHRPYQGVRAFFASGLADRRYGAVAPLMAAHARAAGMQVALRRFPGGHDWRVAHATLAWGFSSLVTWWHLRAPAAATR